MQPEGQAPNQAPASIPIHSVPIQQPQYIQSGGQTMLVQPGQQIIIQQGTSGMAVTSFVFGVGGAFCYLAGWFVCFTFLIAWIFAIFAIIFGHLAYPQAKHTGEGAGLSIAGLTLGYLVLLGHIVPFIGLSL